ncbi:MAG: polyphenol oxidase family protein [Solirubrobacterales bacterium]|nr:polyphenol oxidase family protein [Solirubrobacterales bacterium]
MFTTRRGGFSRGPYASLNLGRLTDDSPDAVRRNRAQLEARAGVRPAYIRQVHGTAVRLIAGNGDIGVAPLPDGDVELLEADGQATVLPGVAPMVMTADCLPIAVAGAGAVAMLHAGWRGLAGGILAEGVRKLRELGADGELRAAIGPGAGPCCYEVGEEVHAEFTTYGKGVRRGRNLDLKAIARDQLSRAGVAAVHDVGLCTICTDESLFFSHRRDHGVTGRQAGLAWLS